MLIVYVMPADARNNDNAMGSRTAPTHGVRVSSGFGHHSAGRSCDQRQSIVPKIMLMALGPFAESTVCASAPPRRT